MTPSSENLIPMAAYCRVSTEKEDQLSSLETQKAFFEEYARTHHYRLVRLYADEGISGTKLKNRRAFHQMMEDAEKGAFQRVFVKDISRFARNAVDFLNSIRKLKSMGIQCDFVNANLSTEDGEFTLGILALVAQEESANLSKRVKFGKAKNARLGKVPNAVYGYEKQKGELFHLTINPQEAAVVRRIFHDYTQQGFGANKIAQALNQEGFKTKRGCRFSQNAVMRILQNPIYIGKIINGKEEIENFLTGVRRKKDPSAWIVTENPELAMISGEVFQKAQRLLAQKRKTYRTQQKKQSARYPFSTLIQCSHCGYHFRRLERKNATGRRITWVCSGRNANGKDFCQNQTVIEENWLKQKIYQYLKDTVCNNNSFYKTLSQEYIRQLRMCQPYQDKKQLEQSLKKLKRLKMKQTQMYEEDAITLEELKERTLSLNQDIVRIQNQISSLDQDQSLKACPWAAPKHLPMLLEALDNAAFKELIETISVSPQGEIHVLFRALEKEESV